MPIALLGCGLMGTAIGQRLLETGHQLVVWNRTAARTATLVEAGAHAAGSPLDALLAADTAILTLADASAIDSVLATPGLRDALQQRLILQMGTIAPAQSRELAAAVPAAGGQ